MPDLLDLVPKEVVTSQQPRGLSLGQVAQPYQELGAALDKMGAGLEDVATPLAERQGAKDAQSITRDAQGNLVVAPPPAIFGPAGTAYVRALHVGALAQADGDAKRADLQLRQQFRDNPGAYDQYGQPTGGYLSAADAYKKKTVEQYSDALGPAVGNAVGQTIDATTTQTYRGLLNEKERLDLERADSSMTARMTSARDDAMALARQGVGTDNPAMVQALDAYSGVLDERANNPRLAYSKDQRTLDLQTFQGDLAANRFLYHTNEAYKSGGAQAAEQSAQDILSNPDYKLTPAERDRYYHEAIGEVRANEAIRHQSVGEARAAWSEIKMSSLYGQPIDPEAVDSAINAFKAAGDYAGAAAAGAYATHMKLNDQFGLQPLGDQVTQLKGLVGGTNAASYNQALGKGDVQGALRASEGLRTNAYWDVNHWRTGYGSDTVTRADGSVEPVTAMTQITPADAERDLIRRTGLAADQAQKQIGGAWDQMSAATRAALTSVVYNYGHLPNDVAAAAASGSPEALAGAIASHAADNAGANAARRQAEAAAVTGKFGLTGVEGQAPTPASSAWLQRNRELTLNKDLWDGWKSVMKDYDEKQTQPANDVVDTIMTGARQAGNGALLAQISHDMSRIGYAQTEAAKPLGQQSADITKMDAMAQAGKLQPGQADLLKDLQARYNSISTGLEDNPVKTAVTNFADKLPTPGPLDLSNPQNLVAGLKARASIVQVAANNWGTGPLAALDKQDLIQVKSALANPDPAVKAGIYGAFATLPEDVRNATLKKIGGGEPAGMAEAAAGSMMADAPAIGMSIFRGQAAMKADKRYDPETENEGKANYLSDLDKALPATAFSLQGRTDPGGPYSTIATMVKGRYADLAAQAGQTTYAPAMLKQAVTDVTGGILSHNGAPFIAPARGMDQQTFDGVLRGVTDNDMGGAVTLGGQRITADYLRSNGQLESAGDGRYFVRLGRDPMKPIYAYSPAQAPPQGNGQWSKFTLDLRNRAPMPREPVDESRPDWMTGQ